MASETGLDMNNRNIARIGGHRRCHGRIGITLSHHNGGSILAEVLVEGADCLTQLGTPRATSYLETDGRLIEPERMEEHS
jgi:hypothetical protein